MENVTEQKIKQYLNRILTKSCCISKIELFAKDRVMITDGVSIGYLMGFREPYSVANFKKHYAMALIVKKELEGLGFTSSPFGGGSKKEFNYLYCIDTDVLETNMKAILRKEKLEDLMAFNVKGKL